MNMAFRRAGGVGDAGARIIKPRPDEQLAEYIDAILARYSVFDLREISDDDIERATARLERGQGFIGCVRSGTRNMIDWFEIASGDRVYEIRRFETFWFCSCPGFTFSRSCCKHIAFINSQQSRKVIYGNITVSSRDRKRTDVDGFGTGQAHRPSGQTGTSLRWLRSASSAISFSRRECLRM
jgi:hypothetical protein